MPIYEYKCEDCSNVFELFFKSYSSTKIPKCIGCESLKVKKIVSSVSFNSKSHSSDGYFSDSSNIGKHVEQSFSKHGLQMPNSVRKSIDSARKGKMPKGLDI
ncbi:MAG: FmdB family zinc ribbon protein [Dehalococcoidia bacterium]